MAKGILHLNVEFSAVTDEEGKFGRLATLLGLADSAHALGMCTRLWLACTRRGEAELPQWLVEQILGERGPDALVEAELASWAGGRGDSKTRRLRIGGAEKHCLWMVNDQAAKRDQSSKGGKTRAATASRAGGRFTSGPPAGPPAQTSPSELSSASDLPEDQNSPSARAIPPAVPQPEPAPVPAVSPPAPAREDIARTHEADRPAQTETGPNRPIRPEAVDATLRANPPPAPGTDRPEPTLDQLWSELELARQRAAEHHRVTLGPLLAHDARRADLANLLAEAARVGQRSRLVGQIRHAIAVAESEAIADRDQLQWLSGAVFSERNFGRLVAAPAPKKRTDPRPARPRNHDPPPIPREQLAGPEQFAEARALLAAATSNDDTPPDNRRRKAAP